MASLVNQAAQVQGGGPDDFRILRVPQDMLPAAMVRLMGPKADRADAATAVRDFATGLSSRTEFWVALYPGRRLGQVAMVMPSSGRTAGLYLSPGGWGADGPGEHFGCQFHHGGVESDHRERVALMDTACEALRTSPGPQHCVLAQGLLEPEETDLIAAYLDAGFSQLAELGYLRRDVPRFGRIEPPHLPPGVTLTRVADLEWSAAEAQLMTAMERSYIGTLDCPALCGLRSVRDVLDSHVSVGQFDASLWWIVHLHGRPEGCMLLNRFPRHETVELVYVGLGPELRGQGIAAILLQMALGELQRLGERCLACAVDTKNEPALALYRRAKFRQFARRIALIRDLR